MTLRGRLRGWDESRDEDEDVEVEVEGGPRADTIPLAS